AELMSPLLEQMQNSINTVADQQSLDYVLNTRTSAGDVIILYVKPEVRENNDITDAVMQQMGI
ncbi:MAG: OmpH family outer membrane protein, partial [Balneolaceae bacterium]